MQMKIITLCKVNQTHKNQCKFFLIFIFLGFQGYAETEHTHTHDETLKHTRGLGKEGN